jgi:hypothetical protein
MAGIEPARLIQARDFKSLVSTDFTTSALFGGASRSRTGLDGFAIRYITALLTRLRFGAGNETRTRDPNLGKVMLYQLSYSRSGTGLNSIDI